MLSETPCFGERSLIFRSLINLAVAIRIAPPIRTLKTADLESLVSGRNFQILETKVCDEKNAIQWVLAKKA